MIDKNTKLIKLSDTHYIVVDDSEIKEGDWFYFNVDEVSDILRVESKFHLTRVKNHKENKKIVHSTQPLEGVNLLNLSEVEEAINGYSVEKMAEKEADKIDYDFENSCGNGYNDFVEGYQEGFKAHQELVKDKLFTGDNVIELCKILMSNPFEKCGKTYQELADSYIQSLLTKTEWSVTFDEQGKIKLI